MKAWIRVNATFAVFCSFLLFLCHADVVQLTEGNWTNMLKGEWLVKFYAPWCPACRALEPTWERLGQRSFELKMNFAKIDVTENAVLGGRFFIVSLPTVFHVKNGVFRQYSGQKTEVDIVSFVRDELWKEMQPVPWYRDPTSIHMSAVGTFFKFSIAIRDVHSMMTNEYGIPVWGCYVIFAVATILLGLLLGLMVVCCCDAVHFLRSKRRVDPVNSRSASRTQARDDDKVSPSVDDEDDSDLVDDTSSVVSSSVDGSVSNSAPKEVPPSAEREAASHSKDDTSRRGLSEEQGLRHRDPTSASKKD